MPDQSEVPEVSDELRRAGRNVLERLDTDEAFRDALAADPAGTLAAAGIPPEVMPELLMAAAEEGEVEGFAARVQLTRGFLVKNGTGINAGKSSVCKSDVCKSDICGDFDVLRTRSYWYR